MGLSLAASSNQPGRAKPLSHQGWVGQGSSRLVRLDQTSQVDRGSSRLRRAGASRLGQSSQLIGQSSGLSSQSSGQAIQGWIMYQIALKIDRKNLPKSTKIASGSALGPPGAPRHPLGASKSAQVAPKARPRSPQERPRSAQGPPKGIPRAPNERLGAPNRAPEQ